MRVQSIGAYYTLQGAAEALGVSYWQVARAVRQRQTPTLILGQTQLVKLDDLRGLFASDAAEEGASAQQERESSSPASYRVMGHVFGGGRLRELGSRTLGFASDLSLDRACPQCGSHALVYEEGCQKCYACGYAAC